MTPPRPLGTHPAADVGPRVDWAAMRRVLAVRPDNLGDVLLLGPALRALRAAAPAARLDLLASPAGAAVAPLLPEVDGVLEVSPVWQDARGELPVDPDRELALAGRLRGYHALVVFTSFAQSPWPAAFLGYLAGVPVRAALSKEFGGSVLSHWVSPPPDDVHQVDRALHLLRGLGIRADDGTLAVRLPGPARAEAAAALRSAGVAPGAPYAVVAPGASCPSRHYPADRFAAVVAGLAVTGLAVAVVGSAREAALVDAVAAGTPGAVPLAGRVGVPGLAALLAGAAVAVTNNSGGMHLADAVRTPLVALFAGTELESQYAPRSTRAVLLRRPTACAPCRTFACPYAHECLDVPPGEVLAAALGLLAEAAA